MVYISHRLEEIVQIGDRVTILRDGKYIQTIPVKDTDVDGLARLMVGRELSEKFPKSESKTGETLLEVKHLQQNRCCRIFLSMCGAEKSSDFTG